MPPFVSYAFTWEKAFQLRSHLPASILIFPLRFVSHLPASLRFSSFRFASFLIFPLRFASYLPTLLALKAASISSKEHALAFRASNNTFGLFTMTFRMPGSGSRMPGRGGVLADKYDSATLLETVKKGGVTFWIFYSRG